MAMPVPQLTVVSKPALEEYLKQRYARKGPEYLRDIQIVPTRLRLLPHDAMTVDVVEWLIIE